jgi:DNA polymerase-3 subunit delta
MVAFKAARGEQVCARPPDNIRALLIYGPNNGLIRERAKAAVKFAVEDFGDPFRLGELDARDVVEDPARLADELAALSLGGGRRAVWLTGAGDSIAEAVSNGLEINYGDTLLVIESGNLTPQSALRKLFEKDPDLAAVACYDDDQNSLRNYVSDILAAENAAIDHDALSWLLSRLGNDRMQVRGELEKLILYASSNGGGPLKKPISIDLDAVTASAGDAGVLSLDSLADAVASGNLADIDRYLDLALQQGVQPIGAIRSVSKRFIQLHFVVGSAARGETIERLMSALRPPIFFKNRHAFQAQTKFWPLSRIGQALDILCEAEIDCKTTGMPSGEICARALIRIGGAARLGKGRG